MSAPTGVFWDGNYPTASEVGPKIYEQPFERDDGRYIYSQKFHQALSSYSPTARGTVDPGDATFWLDDESTPQHIDGGLCEFLRFYAKKPAPRSEPETIVHSYQELLASGSGYTILEFPVTITSRVYYDYFRIAASGADYTDPFFIPILRALHYAQNGNTVKLLGTRPAAPATITSSSVANPSVITVTAHGLSTGQLVAITGHSGSTPSINSTYAITVIDADHFSIPVNVTVGGTGGTVTAQELLGEDSIITAWKADIYQRKTRYVPTLTSIAGP